MSQFERKLGVVLGIPSPGLWYEGFGTSLMAMIGHFMHTPVMGYRSQKIIPCSIVGSILPRQRKECVKTLLDLDGSHIAWLDADQTYPKNTLHRLIGWDKDIVGCNIAVKKIPSIPTARGFNKEVIYTEESQSGLEKVWSVGCGVLLMKRKVFEKIGYKCFEILWNEEIDDYNGEDWGMLNAAREAGFDIWIDHGLSNEVGHLGTYKYTHDVVGEVEQTLPIRAVSG